MLCANNGLWNSCTYRHIAPQQWAVGLQSALTEMLGSNGLVVVRLFTAELPQGSG